MSEKRPFSVREYRPGDEEGIVALFNRVFSHNNPTFIPRVVDIWRHVYLGNPFGHQIMLATDEHGEIIGNYSAIPTAQSVRGERRLGTQIVDTMVHPDWRGMRKGGVFVEVTRAWKERFCHPAGPAYNDYFFGVIDDQIFKVGSRVVGYVAWHWPVPVWTRPVDAAWVDELQAAGAGVTVTASDWSGLDAWQALFEQHVGEVPLGVWRTAEYLAWRYRDWPGAPFKALQAHRDGEFVGALIYREGIEWEARPGFLLLDWIGPSGDRETVAALLAAVSRAALQAGRARVECFPGPGRHRPATLAALGMVTEPSRFNSAGMIFTDTFDDDWLRENWSLAMGDFDVY